MKGTYRSVLGALLVVAFTASSAGIAGADYAEDSLDNEALVTAVAEANEEVAIDTTNDLEMIEIAQGAEVVSDDMEAAVLDLDDGNGVVVVAREGEDVAIPMILPDGVEEVSVEEGMAIIEPSTMDDVSFTMSTNDEGTVHIYSVLENREAPEHYDYDFPSVDFIFGDDESGATYLVQFTESDVEIVGVLEAPWAVDANGVQVPTYFEINGTTVTQVVEHAAGDYAYPIVADPSWDDVKGWFAKAGSYVKNKAQSAARALGSDVKWLGGKAWDGTKWVAGKGKVLARRVPAGAAVFCAVGGAWFWYKADSQGWVRLANAAEGCFVGATGARAWSGR